MAYVIKHLISIVPNKTPKKKKRKKKQRLLSEVSEGASLLSAAMVLAKQLRWLKMNQRIYAFKSSAGFPCLEGLYQLTSLSTSEPRAKICRFRCDQSEHPTKSDETTGRMQEIIKSIHDIHIRSLQKTNT